MKKLQLSLFVLTSVLVPVPAFAGILSTTGITQISAPTSADYPTSDSIQVFSEAEDVSYPSSGINLDAGTIASGTSLDSYKIYFNTEDNSSSWKNATGSITFDKPILGLIWSRGNLASSDSTFGALGTPNEQTGRWRGLESNDTSGLTDFFTAGGGDTLNLNFNIVSEGYDELRVVTAAAPEPLTMLGAGTAISFGVAFRKKLAKKQKAKE
jgi:hypothetical protein